MQTNPLRKPGYFAYIVAVDVPYRRSCSGAARSKPQLIKVDADPPQSATRG